jgi:hypothetical protein
MSSLFVRCGPIVLIKSPMRGLSSVLERLARDFDLIFSTLRLERDYIDATDRRLTQLTFTRRTQPACPVVIARCGLQAF